VKPSRASLRPHRSALAIAIAIAVGYPAQAQVAPKAPEPATLQANAVLAKTLPFADRQDFDDAIRGYVGSSSTRSTACSK